MAIASAALPLGLIPETAREEGKSMVDQGLHVRILSGQCESGGSVQISPSADRKSHVMWDLGVFCICPLHSLKVTDAIGSEQKYMLEAIPAACRTCFLGCPSEVLRHKATR